MWCKGRGGKGRGGADQGPAARESAGAGAGAAVGAGDSAAPCPGGPLLLLRQPGRAPTPGPAWAEGGLLLRAGAGLSPTGAGPRCGRAVALEGARDTPKFTLAPCHAPPLPTPGARTRPRPRAPQAGLADPRCSRRPPAAANASCAGGPDRTGRDEPSRAEPSGTEGRTPLT